MTIPRDDVWLGKPDWTLFQRFVEGCDSELLICSPWVSSEGVQRLEQLLCRKAIKRLRVWCRLPAPETDAPGLLRLVRRLANAGVAVELRDCPSLHAKVYVSDGRRALFGSANLSDAGFRGNLELVALTSNPGVVRQALFALAEFEAGAIPVLPDELEAFLRARHDKALPRALEGPSNGCTPSWRQGQRPSFRPEGVADDASLPKVAYTVGPPFDPLALVKKAHAILESRREELLRVDFGALFGKRGQITGYPTHDDDVMCGMRHGVMPFDDYVGTFTGPFEPAIEAGDPQGQRELLRGGRVCAFRRTRCRREIAVTPLFPLPDALSKATILHAWRIFHLASVPKPIGNAEQSASRQRGRARGS